MEMPCAYKLYDFKYIDSVELPEIVLHTGSPSNMFTDYVE